MKGKVIYIDGLDGCGKGTLVGNLKQALEDNGYRVVTLAVPARRNLGAKVRSILLDHNSDHTPCTEAELLLMLASFADELNCLRDLEHDTVYLVERHFISTIAYQIEGKELPYVHSFPWIEIIQKMASLYPADAIVYLDISPEVSKHRTASRGIRDKIESRGNLYYQRVADAYEKHIHRFENVKTVPKSIAENGTRTEVFEYVFKRILPEVLNERTN